MLMMVLIVHSIGCELIVLTGENDNRKRSV